MATRNPFTPSFGKIPAHFAGRDLFLQDMHDAFENGPGDPNLSTILVGARGTGKTALLTSIASDAKAYGWIAVNVSAVPGMLEDIVERTAEASNEFVNRPSTVQVSSAHIGGVLDIALSAPAAEHKNWRTKMNAILDQLARYDIGLLITVDEVTVDLDEMIQLATVYQHFVREDRKVALLLAGLPSSVSNLISSKQTSFLRRCRRCWLGRIDDADIASAVRATIEDAGGTIEEDALADAVNAIAGFPYMMQLVGYRMWSLSSNGNIDDDNAHKGIELARKELFDGVIETTYQELSPGDIRFVQAMLFDSTGSTLAAIAERMGVESNYASIYKRRLLEAGVIGTRGANRLDFELPGFRDYLLEHEE